VFAVAAETGWPEERILFMPLARLAQYQHCLLRRNGVRTHWSGTGEGGKSLRGQLEALRMRWAVSAESYPDEDVKRVKAEWQRRLSLLDTLKREHLDGPPITIDFTPEALKRLGEIVHPFANATGGEGCLQMALTSRWQQEAVPRWALVLAMMRYDGGDLPEVTSQDIDSACTFLFRAHRDAVELAGVYSRSPEEVSRDQLVAHLQGNGGQMALASGNTLGLSIAKLERIVADNPETLQIAPVSTGGRGRPKKHVLLNA
jgi:cytosine/adenosine deaminase-related metal-dependent hydrolase